MEICWRPGGEDGVVTVIDVTQGKPLHLFKGHSGRIQWLSFSPDAKSIASASNDGNVRVWKLATAQQSRVLGSHELPVFSVAWSPDGRWLAVGTGEDSTSSEGIVKIWDVLLGKLVTEIRAAKGRVLGLAFSADGRTLATGGYDSYVRLWDAASGRLLREFVGRPSDELPDDGKVIGTLAVSKDGMLAAGFGSPAFHQSDYNQVAKIWDLDSGRELAILDGHANTICSVAFAPDGKLLATASDDQRVKLWSVRDGRIVRTLSGTERFKSVVFSPDGEWVIAGGVTGDITAWEAATGRHPVGQLTGHANGVQRLCFSPDGRTIASASWDSTVKLWNPLSARETRTLREHTDWISCLAFSPDGNTLATGSFDATVRLWDAASARQIADEATANQALAQSHEKIRRLRQEQRAADGNFSLTNAELDQYVGRYEGGLVVNNQDGHLTIHPIQGTQGAEISLYPQSANEFICRDREVDITFLKDEQGEVSRLIVYRDGEAVESKKQRN